MYEFSKQHRSLSSVKQCTRVSSASQRSTNTGTSKLVTNTSLNKSRSKTSKNIFYNSTTISFEKRNEKKKKERTIPRASIESSTSFFLSFLKILFSIDRYSLSIAMAHRKRNREVKKRRTVTIREIWTTPKSEKPRQRCITCTISRQAQTDTNKRTSEESSFIVRRRGLNRAVEYIKIRMGE